MTSLLWLQRASIIHGHPIPKSLQGALSAYRGRSSKGGNSELVGAIDEYQILQDDQMLYLEISETQNINVSHESW